MCERIRFLIRFYTAYRPIRWLLTSPGYPQAAFEITMTGWPKILPDDHMIEPGHPGDDQKMPMLTDLLCSPGSGVDFVAISLLWNHLWFYRTLHQWHQQLLSQREFFKMAASMGIQMNQNDWILSSSISNCSWDHKEQKCQHDHMSDVSCAR